MKQRKPYLCPTSGKEYILPSNLYPHARGVEGKWRYKGVNGMKDLNHYTQTSSSFMPPQTAIKAAEMLNESYVTDKRPKIVGNKELLGYLKLFIEEYESEHPSRVGTDSWTQGKRYLHGFAEAFKTTKLSRLDRKMLKTFWQGTDKFAYRIESATREAQRQQRAPYARFLDFLHDNNAIPAMENSNPFKVGSTGEFKLKEGKPKMRGRLELSDFNDIIAHLNENKLEWAADACELASLTMFRITDLCTLRWDQHYCAETKQFGRLNTKKAKLSGKNVLMHFDLSKLPQLDQLLKRMKARADSQYNCPFIVCQPFGKPAEGKEHPCQVSRNLLTKKFAKARDSLPSMIGVSPTNKPPFHEIKSLMVRLHKKAEHLSMQELSDMAGHGDTRVTEDNYGYDEYNQVVHVSKIIDTQSLPADFLKSNNRLGI